MTHQDLLEALRLTLIVFGYIFVTCSIGCLILNYASKVKFRGTFAAIFAFGFLGVFLGYGVGASRQPIAGTILPALLTFVTVLLGYLFSKEHLKSWRPVIPFCISLLVINTFFGLLAGTMVRKPYDEYEKKYNEWLTERNLVLEIKKASALADLEIRKAKELKIIAEKSGEQIQAELNEESDSSIEEGEQPADNNK